MTPTLNHITTPTLTPTLNHIMTHIIMNHIIMNHITTRMAQAGGARCIIRHSCGFQFSLIFVSTSLSPCISLCISLSQADSQIFQSKISKGFQ